MTEICRKEGCHHHRHGEVDRMWERRPVDGVTLAEYEAAASRLAGIDKAWSRTLTTCNERHPCHSCCTLARAALDGAAKARAKAEP